MWFQVKHSHLPKVSLQVAFCRELGGGDLVANLFTNLHKVTKGKKKKYQHYPALKDEKCIEMLKDVERC